MTPAPPSPPSLPPPVKDQCPPAGHQDSLMVTVLTLGCVALMVVVILVGKVGGRLDVWGFKLECFQLKLRLKLFLKHCPQQQQKDTIMNLLKLLCLFGRGKLQQLLKEPQQPKEQQQQEKQQQQQSLPYCMECPGRAETYQTGENLSFTQIRC